MKQLLLGQVLGKNQFLRKKILVVQSILNGLRPGETPLIGVAEDTPVTFGEAAVLWGAAHIIPRGIIPQDAMLALIQMFPERLLAGGEKYGKLLEEDADSSAAFIIAMSDRRFVTISGAPLIFDMLSCKRVGQAPRCFEGVSYNLTEPIRREWQRIQEEDKDVHQRTAEKSFAEPGNTSHGTADSGKRPTGPGVARVGPADGQHGDAGATRGSAQSAVFQQTYGGQGAGGK